MKAYETQRENASQTNIFIFKSSRVLKFKLERQIDLNFTI